MHLGALFCDKSLAMCALASFTWLAASMPVMASDASKLLGTWKAVSFTGINEATGEETRGWGDNPKGYLIFLPHRMFAFIDMRSPNPPAPSPEGRPPRPGVMAYSGPYQVDGDSFTTSVDMSAFDGWVGTQQKRFFKIKGDRLEVTTLPLTRPDGVKVHSLLIWQRDK